MRARVSFYYPGCWASYLVRRYGILVRFLSRELDGSEEHLIRERVEIIGSPTDIGSALKFLDRYSHIAGYRVIEVAERDRRAVLEIDTYTSRCPLYQTISDFSWGNDRPIIERVDSRGRVYWEVRIKRRQWMDRIARQLKDRFHVEELNAQVIRDRAPSADSIRMLKVAYEEGYFDVPKKTNLMNLSRQFGVPVSTLNTALRRAVRHVLDKFVR